MKKIHNIILRGRVDYWLNKLPVSKNAFEHPAVEGLLHFMDTIGTVKDVDKKILCDFIDGLVFIPYIIKEGDSESNNIIENLIRPGLNIIEDYVKNEYQDFLIKEEITGEEVLKINDVEVPISHKQIKQHIKRTKSLPLTTNDISKITSDFVRYKKDMFKENNLPTQNKTYKNIIYYPSDPKSLIPVTFCGEPILYEGYFEAYQAPYDILIEPLPGEHDYKNCEGCLQLRNSFVTNLTSRYNGNGKERLPFPLCCEYHKNLINIQFFRKIDFDKTPEITAKKIVYLKQQVINGIEQDDWYKRITDYFDYVFESFGKMPSNCGEPLYFNDCYRYIFEFIESLKDEKVSKEKIKSLLGYLKSYKNPIEQKTDLNILMQTYEKWFKIFPFALNSYFGSLKSYFETHFPLFHGKPEVNQYTNIAKVKAHTKESLINHLIHLTDTLLTQINGVILYEKGLITDANKIKLDLVIQSRKLQIQKGYINKSSNEEEGYRKILKQWFKEEKDFIDEITPLLNKNQMTEENAISTFYFTREFTDNELLKLYQDFKNKGFISSKTKQSHFSYIFSGKEIPESDKPFIPIIWLKSQILLAYMIYNTFSDIDKNIWSITENCFRIKNSIPNTKTMKKDMSEINQGYSNKPKGYKDIDNILLQK